MTMRRALWLILALLAEPALAEQPNGIAFIAPTPSVSANNGQIANTSWVNSVIASGMPLASGKIWIGSDGNIATPQTMSGDCTVSVAGVLTCIKSNGAAFGPAAFQPTPACANDGSHAWVFAGGTIVCASLNAASLVALPQGRITLTSGTPVMATSVTAAATVYFTTGNVPIYNGSNFLNVAFAEVSQATTDATKSPAAVANNLNYDIFCWVDSATNRCTRGPPWTSGAVAGNDVQRGTGAGSTELIAINGIYLNKNDITNGPAAQRGTFVGSIRSNGTATIDWTLGNLAAGGGAARLAVSNAFNQVDVKTNVADTASTWSYSSATPRQAHGSTGMQVSFLSCLPNQFIEASYSDSLLVAAVNGAFVDIGLGFNSITVYDKRAEGSGTAATSLTHALIARGTYPPQTGWHTVAALENADGTNSTTFVGNVLQTLAVSAWQ